MTMGAKMTKNTRSNRLKDIKFLRITMKSNLESSGRATQAMTIHGRALNSLPKTPQSWQ